MPTPQRWQSRLRAAGNNTASAPGVQWLVQHQASNGGFANGGGTLNANSTGLAGQALLSAGRLVPAARALLFVRGLQVACAGAPADRGAIAFDATGFDPATANRATAQGILALAPVGFEHLTAAGSAAGAPTLRCP